MHSSHFNPVAGVPYRMKKLLRLLFSVFVCAFVIAACGQKGPLFLPGNPSEIQTEVPAEAEEENEDDEDSDSDSPN